MTLLDKFQITCIEYDPLYEYLLKFNVNIIQKYKGIGITPNDYREKVKIYQNDLFEIC